MYSYSWDAETGGILLNSSPLRFSKEPRPVYYKELDILGLDKLWDYEKNDVYPYMWAEANNYFYRGKLVAKTNGGALYTAPEVVVLDKPEPDNKALQFIDIPTMVEKNKNLLDKLTKDTIKKVYNTYIEYKDKIDIFYVAFSGGKDSVVTLDIVQKSLPHNAFKVLFGDTRMEFPDTYVVIDKAKELCKEWNVDFLTSQSVLDPEYTWNTIGPPAQRMRWCCSVHKTAPQILLLREITKNSHFRGMAIMGVRSCESTTRRNYEELNFGTKHKGQYDYYPILEWNSAELFLYIYQNNLIINETYKKGNSRAGCLVCPMEAKKNSWFKNQCYANNDNYKQTTTFYQNIIIEQTFAKTLPEEKLTEFMEIGVWKSRHNGSKLANPQNLYVDEKINNDFIITIYVNNHSWKEWFKTLGDVLYLSNNIINIIVDDMIFKIEYTADETKQIFAVKDIGNSKNEINFISCLKTVLKKASYCIKCRVCEANCPYGYISMNDKDVVIDKKCTKCKKCYKVNNGCLVAASQMLPKENNKMNGSIDQYKNMGIRYQWVEDYFKKGDDFWNDNELGSMMITALKTFLRHAKISEKNKMTDFGKLIGKIGIDKTSAWGLILCNVAYTPQFNWWIKNITPFQEYSSSELNYMLEDSLTANSRKNVLQGFKNIFMFNPILSFDIGFGIVNISKKGNVTFLESVKRTTWKDPDPLVVLYSLYKFAEACEGYYQFTLTRLLDHSIESDGISPTEIFGLDRNSMEKLLTGLDFNHPDFITAQFNLDLDTITLNPDKTSQDVLTLF